jgi:1,4-dihydroxy-6-naphthoate synthase
MKLTLGFSPCPNDTFIFDALVNGLIDTEGLEFEVFLEDVQTLNEWAIAGKLDLSKISYGVLPLLTDHYRLLQSGGALGRGVGPLLITKTVDDDWRSSVNQQKIAIPGRNTTAHLLFSLAFPEAKNKDFLVFHEIENAVLEGRVDAGVIIHENRFTYQQKGLHKLIDLGEYWEQQTQAPIPLGGIVAHKRIGRSVALQVDKLIRSSLEHAFASRSQLSDYVKMHAQEMSSIVMQQHIDLYVNDFSLKLGNEGRKAVNKLLEVYDQVNHTALAGNESIFLS